MAFFPPFEVSPAQGAAVARALHTVAAVDGTHPTELALIDALFADTGEAPGDIAADELAAALPSADLRLMCMKLAYLVAHVEGGVSEAERAVIDGYAAALELTAADCLALEEQVLDELARIAQA
jgi:hypothetical protein